MKGGRRNATGLKINVAGCWKSVQVFLTHNHSFLQIENKTIRHDTRKAKEKKAGKRKKRVQSGK